MDSSQALSDKPSFTLRQLLLWLVAEVLVVFIVIALFKIVPSRLVAAFLAGSLFVGFGASYLWWLTKHRSFYWRLSFWLVLAHLFGTSLPMLVTRVFYLDRGFHEILILGIPGPHFHYLAEKIFAALILATFIDLVIVWWGHRKAKISHSAL